MIQVDSVGNVILASREDVTKDMVTDIRKLKQDTHDQQTSQITSRLSTKIDGLSQTADEEIETATKALSSEKSKIDEAAQRLGEVDEYILSAPGKSCPVGYRRITSVNKCRDATKHLRRFGFSNAEAYGNFNRKDWNEFLHGCFAVDDNLARFHFNHNVNGGRNRWIPTIKIQNQRELSVCERVQSSG